MTLNIVHRTAGADCASILAELPEWFGLPESNAAYAELATSEPAWVAEEGAAALGLMVLKDHGFDAIEIYLLAVRPALHNKGVGRALIEVARKVAADRGAAYLTVKTRGPSKPYEPYARTRGFYEAVGFTAIEEIEEIWGPENPALIMIMPVRLG
jgi:ribosomal protein S18 acetylase RimI-like enzyme